MWEAKNAEAFNIGYIAYDPFFSGTAYTGDVKLKINKMIFTASEEGAISGSAKLYWDNIYGDSIVSGEVEVTFWNWNDAYLTGGQNDEVKTIGQIICTQNNNFNIQVVDVSNKKMDIIFQYITYLNQSGTTNVFYSPILSFKKE